VVVLSGLGCTAPPQAAPEIGSRTDNGTLIRAETSAFSDIRVRADGSVRGLYFAEPTGVEVRQSMLDVNRPGRLLVPYTRTMFASMLFKHPQDRVLVVGLGGGSMVRFINHHFPRARVDAVEIDPVIVGLADEVFGTRPGPRTRIFTEDAIVYLQRNTIRYDVIYMDAFLKPGADTDARGIPRRLKTVGFLRDLHRQLTPGGVVAFNLVEHPGLKQDLRTIAEAFPVTYVFRVPQTLNLTVIASPEPGVRSRESLRAAGADLDAKLDTGFSFRRLVDLLESPR